MRREQKKEVQEVFKNEKEKQTKMIKNKVMQEKTMHIE